MHIVTQLTITRGDDGSAIANVDVNNSCAMISQIIALSPLVLQMCHFVYAGDGCKARDCLDIQCYGLSGDGPHIIYPDGGTNKPVKVSCEQKLFSGGWLIFQRKTEGGVLNFTQSWDDYRHGFGGQGDEATELWLGNEHVHQISSGYGATNCILYITVTAYDGTVCSALIQRFKLDNEDMNYTMRFSKVSAIGCGQKDFSSVADQPFSTLDRHGNYGFNDCFKKHSAGWWYYNDRNDSCYDMFLNGPHRPEGVQNDDTMFMKDLNMQLKQSVMMFRPTDADVRRTACSNPCTAKSPKTGCVHEPADDSHRCVCPAPSCAPDCSGLCENGGECVSESCECAEGYKGALCKEAIEPGKTSVVLIVLGLLVSMMVAVVAPLMVVWTVRKKQADAAAEAAAAAASAEALASEEAEEAESSHSFFGSFW